MLFILLSFFIAWSVNATELQQSYETTVYEEIERIVERAKIDCANFIYDLVRQEIDKVRENDSSLSLYEQVMPIFLDAKMKRIIRIGSTYCSEAELYEAAGQVALKNNDIDALIVSSIAAEQKRGVCYNRSIYGLGFISGAIVFCLARAFYDTFIVMQP